jgi:glucokinase
MPYLLAGDIGGTKTLLRLFKPDSPQKPEFEQSFPSQEYRDLTPIVQKFFDAAKTQLGHDIQPDSACLAIAGPVMNHTSYLPNLDWHLATKRLERELNIASIELINDFTAVGYGISELSPSDLYTIQVGSPQPLAPKAYLGAGTGLGEGFRIGDLVMATEGGHVDFAARSAREFEFVRYLCEQLSIDRISYDRVISGRGIVAIYQFLRDTTDLSENIDIAAVVREWEEQTEKLADPAAAISAAAIAKTDPLSETTMEMFLSAYGAEAGNLALKILPFGGIYIAGGIAAKNLPLLQNGTFITAFNHKGRSSELVATIPIYVILNPQVGLMGAAARAVNSQLLSASSKQANFSPSPSH